VRGFALQAEAVQIGTEAPPGSCAPPTVAFATTKHASVEMDFTSASSLIIAFTRERVSCAWR
jgi:hypothetical protein